jgi:proline iminopeptidase
LFPQRGRHVRKSPGGIEYKTIFMQKKIWYLSASVLVLVITVTAFKILVPRHYGAPPAEKRAGTRFMDLATGSRIAYTLLEGKGNKRPFPIVYLHGGPGGAISDMNIRVLSDLTGDGYDVLLYDQAGSGESARLDDIKAYTVRRHIDDLDAITRNLGMAKVVLIGQSWGGILAAFYAGEHPERVDRIIFTNPGPLYPCPAGLDRVEAPDSLHLKSPFFTNEQGNAKTRNLRTMAMKYCALHYGFRLVPDGEADEFITRAGYEINRSTVCDTSKIVKVSDDRSAPRSGYYAGIMTFRDLVEGRDRRPRLKNLDMPVLVLKGQYDNQKWGYTREYLEFFRHHCLKVIPGAGHAIALEQPGLYLEYIRQFLNN